MFHQAMKMEPINVRRWGIDIRPLFDRRVNTGVIEGRVNIIQQPNENQLISETEILYHLIKFI